MVKLPGRGEIVAEKYEVEGVLGEGAMGVVLGARHTITGKPVAIKWVIAPEGKVGRARVLAEAKNAGRIHHPNVVDVYDYGEVGEAVYLVMERLIGIPLSDRREGPMTPRDAVRLMLPVLRGIAAAHAQDVLHRDIKPANIFLCEDSSGRATTVKVVDFGISKLLAPDATKITNAGSILGTPAYMAPEQFRGETLDPRCDQYALGCILYELLEGADPFEAEEISQLVTAKMNGTLRPFAQLVPKALQDIVQRAMHPKRDKRFESIAAFGEALEAFGDGSRFSDTDADWSGAFPSMPAEVPRVVMPEAAPPSPRWPIAVLFALALGAVALIALTIHDGDDLELADDAPENGLDNGLPDNGDDPLVGDDPLLGDDPLVGDDPRLEDDPLLGDDPLVGDDPRLEDDPDFADDLLEESPFEDELPPRMRRRPRMRGSMHRTGMLSLEDF